jgi:alanine racemase
MIVPHLPSPPSALAGGRLTVDLGALAGNWRMLAQRVEGAATSAVVKGDGYGIGLEPAARALAEAGCQTFFVAPPEEGLRLRSAVRDAIIYVLDGVMPGALETLASAKLRPVLGSWLEMEEWAAYRRSGGTVGAAIHVDTGMHRLGLTPGEARKLAQQPDLLATVAPDLLMSHLATADTPHHPLNRKQLSAFRAVRTLLPGIPASLANSAGILLGTDYHFDLVRPGIALYGGAAIAGVASTTRPVVTAEARILQIREVKAGETVGYGATETVKQHSRIAVLAVGYADGYHRLAGSSDDQPGARVYLRGRNAPLVGRVSMDLIAVDVTGVAGAERGDWVELMGPNVPVDEVAHHAGTIGYELLTGLGHRYARTYVEP